MDWRRIQMRGRGVDATRLDEHYVDPRLVELYGRENPRGTDTDFYLGLAELDAQRIIDLRLAGPPCSGIMAPRLRYIHMAGGSVRCES